MTTPTKPPRLPKGTVMHCTESKRTGELCVYPDRRIMPPDIPQAFVACIPCKSAREAKAVVKLHAMTYADMVEVGAVAIYPDTWGSASNLKQWEFRQLAKKMLAAIGVKETTV
jgi:hypothetical protein